MEAIKFRTLETDQEIDFLLIVLRAMLALNFPMIIRNEVR